jgi:hypothetical protein
MANIFLIRLGWIQIGFISIKAAKIELTEDNICSISRPTNLKLY